MPLISFTPSVVLEYQLKMNPTLVSISCLLFLAVYVSAKEYQYNVFVELGEESPQVDGQMQIEIEACGLISRCQKTTVNEISNEKPSKIFKLDYPIKKVKRVSFKWMSTDSDAEAKIKISEVELRQFDKNLNLQYTYTYRTDKEISSGQLVDLDYWTKQEEIPEEKYDQEYGSK